ncbi:DDE superfamily endonuclease [Pycnococcus provasolii]
MKEHCECELAWCRVLLQQEKENIGSQLTFHQLPTTDEVRAREWLHVLVPSTRKCMEKRQAYLKKKSRNCPRFASHHFPHHRWRFKRAEDFSRHSTRRDAHWELFGDALPCSLRWTPPPIGTAATWNSHEWVREGVKKKRPLEERALHNTLLTPPPTRGNPQTRVVDRVRQALENGEDVPTGDVRALLRQLDDRTTENKTLKRRIDEIEEHHVQLDAEKEALDAEKEALLTRAREVEVEHQAAIAELFSEIEVLRVAAEDTNFSVHMLSSSTSLVKRIKALTGMPNLAVFMAWFDLFNLGGMAEQILRPSCARTAGSAQRKRPRGRTAHGLLRIDDYLLTLMILRTGLSQLVVSGLFGVSESYVSRTFSVWIVHMMHVLKAAFPTPNQASLRGTCPLDMMNKMGDAGHIFDATELEIEVPTEKQAQAATWSEYKHRNTIKFLTSVSACGATIFVSEAYPGRITDEKLVDVCGLCDVMEPGQVGMADKGFHAAAYLLAKSGVSMTVPPKRARGQKILSVDQVVETANTANPRIHVERSYKRTKEYRIFKHRISISNIDLATPIFLFVRCWRIKVCRSCRLSKL